VRSEHPVPPLSQATLKVLRPRHHDWELRKGELQALCDLEVVLVHGRVVVRPPAWSGRVPWSGGNEGVVVNLSDDARVGR
jgi:hypothetical protein